MFKPAGNLLTDLFGTEDFMTKSNLFKEFLKQKNQIPFIHFDGENDLENKLFVIKSNGEKATFKQIYDELDYKLNRGPMFYFSKSVVNYSFKTFIIFVQEIRSTPIYKKKILIPVIIIITPTGTH